MDGKYDSSIALELIEENGNDLDLLHIKSKKSLQSEHLSTAEKKLLELMANIGIMPFFPENPIEPFSLRLISDD